MKREIEFPPEKEWWLGFIPVEPHEWGFFAPWWLGVRRHDILPYAYRKAEELAKYYGVRYRVQLRSNGWVALPAPPAVPSGNDN